MSVYVDDFNAPLGRMRMCHMMADTTAELLAMAERIGVSRKWIQNAGTPKEHFDICLAKKRLALQAGAIEVSPLDLVEIVRARRAAAPAPQQRPATGDDTREGSDT